MGHGKGLLMTFKEYVYSFHCDNANQCYWRPEDIRLEFSKDVHIMISVPSSFIDQKDCDCEKDSTPCGCKYPVPIHECNQCADGFWGLTDIGCKSKD